MTGRVLTAAGALALAAALGVSTVGAGAQERAASGAPLLTPWGDPDIQGIFSTDDELGVPFERPEEFGVFEYACHEGNYAIFNILGAARAGEAAGEP